MMVSTRGRYALRVLIDLAENGGLETYVPMKEVAERQGISAKYVERIMPVLTKNGLVEGMHGQGGGYKLTRKPSEYKVGEILRLTEGDLAPVACLAHDAAKCERSSVCRTLSMWHKFNEITNDYFDGITVGDLMEK